MVAVIDAFLVKLFVMSFRSTRITCWRYTLTTESSRGEVSKTGNHNPLSSLWLYVEPIFKQIKGKLIEVIIVFLFVIYLVLIVFDYSLSSEKFLLIFTDLLNLLFVKL